MKQAALFGSEQRRFLEDLPVAAGLAPALGRRHKVGKVQREPRRRRCLRHRRARVTKQGARWRGWCSPTFRTARFDAGRLRARRGRKVRNVERVNLLQHGPQFGLQLGPLIFGLARVLLFDQPAQAPVGEVMHRRIQHESRNQQHQRAGEKAQRLRSMAVARPHPFHTPRERQARKSRESGRQRGHCRRCGADDAREDRDDQDGRGLQREAGKRDAATPRHAPWQRHQHDDHDACPEDDCLRQKQPEGKRETRRDERVQRKMQRIDRRRRDRVAEQHFISDEQQARLPSLRPAA